MCCQCFDAGAIGGRPGLRACECMLDGLGVLSRVGIVLASSRFGWLESQFHMANLEMPSAILSGLCFDPCSMEAGRKPSPGVPFQNTGSTTSPGGAARSRMAETFPSRVALDQCSCASNTVEIDQWLDSPWPGNPIRPWEKCHAEKLEWLALSRITRVSCVRPPPGIHTHPLAISKAIPSDQ